MFYTFLQPWYLLDLIMSASYEYIMLAGPSEVHGSAYTHTPQAICTNAKVLL